MPSFRKELIAEARAMDKANDHATLNNLTKGTYELEITKALGHMPPELEQIINVCLPVNKMYKPETSDNDPQFDDFDTTKIRFHPLSSSTSTGQVVICNTRGAPTSAQ